MYVAEIQTPVNEKKTKNYRDEYQMNRSKNN